MATTTTAKNPLACIVQAIAAIRNECESVPKDGYNSFHKYAYASEAAIANALRPLLKKHKLVIIQSVAIEPAPYVDSEGVTHLVLEFTLAHESGVVWPDVLRVATQGNDRDSKGKHGDKGAFKANTGGYKYFLNRLFMIDTGDDPERSEQSSSGERKAPKPKDASEATKPARLFKDEVWKHAWQRAGAIGANMSDDVHRDMAVEIISQAKRILRLQKAEDANKNQRVVMIKLINAAELDEDGAVVLQEVF